MLVLTIRKVLQLVGRSLPEPKVPKSSLVFFTYCLRITSCIENKKAVNCCFNKKRLKVCRYKSNNCSENWFAVAKLINSSYQTKVFMNFDCVEKISKFVSTRCTDFAKIDWDESCKVNFGASYLLIYSKNSEHNFLVTIKNQLKFVFVAVDSNWSWSCSLPQRSKFEFHICCARVNLPKL